MAASRTSCPSSGRAFSCTVSPLPPAPGNTLYIHVLTHHIKYKYTNTITKNTNTNTNTHHLHLPALHVLHHQIENEILGSRKHQRRQLLSVNFSHEHHPGKSWFNHISFKNNQSSCSGYGQSAKYLNLV